MMDGVSNFLLSYIHSLDHNDHKHGGFDQDIIEMTNEWQSFQTQRLVYVKTPAAHLG